MAPRLAVGTRVRVNDGVAAPDIPEVSIGGWTGTVTQVSKKKSGKQFFVEWDDQTLSSMSAEYRELCEQRMLYHAMACLPEDAIQVLD